MDTGVTSPPIKNWRSTLERIEKYVSPVYFADSNLYSRLYPKCLPVSEVYHAEPITKISSSAKLCPSQRPSFADAIKQTFSEKVGVGSSYGPTWATHWFKIQLEIPDDWLGLEVHFRWDAGSEALLWSPDGKPIQAFSGGISHQKRTDYIISKKLETTAQKQAYYIEMACNTLFGAGKDSMIAPPDINKYFPIEQLEIAVFDRNVYDLLIDFEVLHDLAENLGQSNDRAYQALYTANTMVNTIVLNNRETYIKAHQLALNFFAQKNGASQHTVVPIGNCHIDTAWLWPYGETIRKCARSWSSTINLMNNYDSFIFACSQAQQLYWVMKEYPSLFQSIQERAKQGKFIPVGGTWVEMDGNLPSGESFIRQFLYGQEFFQQQFDRICSEFWLPDTFGYSAQLPQIMKLCGAQYFLSQKLSWSLINTFPHNTFLWEGIDGTAVIAHFPPADTYTANVKVKEILSTVTKLKDKGRVSESVLLYGYGDGGGGPTEDMLERQLRLKDVDGCPKLKSYTPEEFFSNIKKNEMKNLNTWVGELYLELHNGTYTTQALTKLHNRKREFDLHDADFLLTVCATYATSALHTKECDDMKWELEAAWKKLLLNQFHDVLPGSSIKDVYDEAVILYEEIIATVETTKNKILKSLFGEADDYFSPELDTIVVNTLPWERTEIVKLQHKSKPEYLHSSITVPSLGFARIENLTKSCLVKIEKMPDGNFSMKNELISAVIDSFGRILSLKVLGCEKEAIAPGCFANQFVLYDDIPLYWDAWDVMDYHLETGKPILKVKSSASLSTNQTELLVELGVGDKSSLKLEISLLPGKPYLSFKATVNWFENHKFLKVEFPVNVHSREATFDIQFGHLQRPTHFNTSWDSARYEVCGHKWIDLSEYNWGVALLNDCKYGHSVHKNIMRMSLLRAPKSPDDQADMGLHEINYAIMPHQGTLQSAGVIKEAYAFNVPLIKRHVQKGLQGAVISATTKNYSFFSVDQPGIVIETIKLAQKVDKALVVRLYESFGARCTAQLTSHLPLKTVTFCNGLEEAEGAPIEWKNNHFPLKFLPFQIISILMKW